jgi:O-acetyl-ADP-ribose deacetylase (regulator of RNase III)
MKTVQGNLIECNAEALVNTVNCVGVMGKGIALQFKRAYPENFKAYARACKDGKIEPGCMFTYETGNLRNPKFIINFPTKRHWKGKSKIEDIKVGLSALISEINKLRIRSIAVPPLGCGNGGLNWNEVRPLIESAFNSLPDVEIHLYEPVGAPEPDKMPVSGKIPVMTRARALLIKLLEQYAIPGYRLSLLEIQKLAYFLQLSGEPLRLKFVKEKYGPYAENLNFVLQVMEGYFIRGYGDRSRKTSIFVMPDAGKLANKFLGNEPDAEKHLNRIRNLIAGFETPYGMELLASVHWVATESFPSVRTVDDVATNVLAWNAHKRNAFTKPHVAKAWQRLVDEKWLPL